MAKRNRGKKGKPNARKAPASNPDIIATKAHEDLRAGNYRRAREGFRRLMKTEEALFAPLYLEATCGYLQELLDSDRYRQAEDVIRQVQGLLGEQATTALEPLLGRMAAKSGDWVAAAKQVSLQWDSSAEPPLLAARVDALVLAFEPIDLGDEALARDVAAIHQALMALSIQDKSQVDAHVRPIARQSLLADWKRFIKSVSAWQNGEQERALIGFRQLQDQRSVPGRAAAVYLELLEGRAAAPSGKAIALACHVLGHADAGQTVAEADKLWRQQKLRQAYARVSKKHPEFPSAARVGLWSSLSDLFLYRPSVSSAAASPLYRFLESKVRSKQCQSAGEKAALYRWLALETNPREDSEDFTSFWCEFLTAYQAAYGDHPALAVRVHAKIGHDLLHPTFMTRDDEMPSREDAELARSHLEQSVALGPTHLPAYLHLLEAYQVLGEDSARNRMLDTLTKLFPNDKKVLLEAGRGCVKRKAFVKGLGMLRRALEADPLDKKVRGALIHGLGEQAFHYFRKGDLDRGRDCFVAMEALATQDVDDFDCGLAYVLVRHDICELLYAEAVPELQQRGVSLLGEHVWLFAKTVYCGLYFDKIQQLKRKSIVIDESYLKSSSANGADAARMTALLVRWQPQLSPSRDTMLCRHLQTYLKRVLRLKAFTREDARAIVQLQFRYKYEVYIDRFAEEMLKRDPEDPFFRIIIKRELPLGSATEELVEELKNDIDRATKLGDQEAVELGRARLGHWEKELEQRAYFADDDDWDDDDDLWPIDGGAFGGDDSAASWAIDELGRMEQSMPGITDMMKEIAHRNTRNRERLRKELGIPRHVFESFILFAETLKVVGYFEDPVAAKAQASFEDPSPSPPALPSSPKKKQPPSTFPPQMDQLDLFG